MSTELREAIEKTLLGHMATSTSGCHCGGVGLGESIVKHQADKVMEVLRSGVVAEADLRAALDGES